MEFPEFKKLFGRMPDTGLLPHEKHAMREELKYFIAQHPARAPILVRTFAHIEGMFAYDTRGYGFARPFATALVLVLGVGIGTSYAAEGALPGDTLYPVKIHMNESLQGALALSSDAKASWNTERAARRMGEAETLASKGKLTPLASSIIQIQLEQTSNDFNDSVASISVGTDTAPRAAEVRSDFEATLTAHSEVLQDLAQTIPNSRDTIEPILAHAAQQIQDNAQAREDAERIVVASNSPEVHSAALDKKTVAEGRLRALRAQAAPRAGKGAALRATAAQIAATSTIDHDTQETIQQGDQNLSEGQYGKAFTSFQAAIRAADVSSLKTSIQEKLRGAGDSNSGEGSSGGGSDGSSTGSGSTTIEFEIND